MTPGDRRIYLVESLTADAEAIASTLDTLPRHLRAEARSALRQVWEFTEDPGADLSWGAELARSVDALRNPPSTELSNALWKRLNQHWPLRVACAQPHVVATVAEASLSFFALREARTEWLWRSLTEDKGDARSPDSHPAVAALDFSVVDKGGRK